MNILLSVIVLNFNTKNYLERCLRSVIESKGFEPGKLEVIVVDNGSSDGSIEAVGKFKIKNPKFKIRLIQNEKNLGFAGGNNAGIKQAKGKYLLLLNSDTKVYSDTLIKMAQFADSLPNLGAATGRVELPDGRIDPACHRGFPTPGNAAVYLIGLEKLFPNFKFFGGYHQGWKNYSAPHEVDVISGAFFMVPRKVIGKVGLLDKSFFMYGEDIDWCYRIKQAGFEIWYNPGARIIHYKKQSGRAKNQESRIKNQANYQFVHTMEQFYRKHYMNRYPKPVSWLVLMSINLLKQLHNFRRSESLDFARDGEVKRVVIDARLAGLKNAGIGRYIQSLIENLGIARPRIKKQESRISVELFRSDIKHYSFQEQLSVSKEIKKLKPDLVHVPHFNVPLLYNKPFVVTIHDLLWHERIGFSATTLPRWVYLIKYWGYRMVLRHAVLKSEAIIVPSQWVKKKIIERFPQINNKIYVIYEGVSGAFRRASPPRRRDSSRYSFPYIIYTGSLYPHKNVSILLDILKHFTGLKLVVACSRSVFWERFRQEVSNRELTSRVVLAGFVPDKELAILYRKAAALVFPSLSEGFGLPGLEAMAAGCPVISSTAGALPEVYGNAAAYFDPKSERDLKRAIEKVREDKRYRKELIRRGKERSERFSWKKCAKETLEVYQIVLKAQ